MDSYSQNCLWAKSAAGAIVDEAYAVSADINGNVFVTGSFSSRTITFGSTTLTNDGFSNVFIAKYDAIGNVIWAKSAAGKKGIDFGSSVSADAAGNVFVTGTFSSRTITFDSIRLINAGSYDAFIAKYDANGNVIWAESIRGTGNDEGYSVSTNARGNVFVTGYFQSPTVTFSCIDMFTTLTNAGSNDIFIAEYDANGNVIWAKSAGGTGDDKGYSVSADAKGNVFVTGGFSSPTITFGVTNLANADNDGFNPNVFIAKYDANGNVVWAKSAGGTGNDEGISVSADRRGDVFVTGYFSSPTIAFGLTTLTNAGDSDVFLTKYDATGNVLWAKRAGGTGKDEAYSVSADARGNAFVTGAFYSSSMVFDATALKIPPADCSFQCDPMFIVKYDATGNVLHASALASGGHDQNSISTDPYGNAYIGGNFNSSPFIVGSYTLTNTGTQNIFVAKLNSFFPAIHKIHVSDFYLQGALGIMGSPSGTLDDFKTLAPRSVLLSPNLQSNGTGRLLGAEGMYAFGAVIKFADKQKTHYKINPQLRIGVSYFSEQSLLGNFNRQIDSANTGQNSTIYTTKQIRFDAAVIFRTHRRSDALAYLYGGIGIAAGMTIIASTNISSDTLKTADSTTTSHLSEKFRNKSYGFVYSVSFPMGVDFRLGKKREFWRHLNGYFEFRPEIGSTSIPELNKNIISRGVQISIGLRIPVD